MPAEAEKRMKADQAHFAPKLSIRHKSKEGTAVRLGSIRATAQQGGMD